jgi:O-methyltransferase
MDVNGQLARAEELWKRGERDNAIKGYVDVYRSSYGNGVAKDAMIRLSQELFANAITVRDRGDRQGAIDLAVRSLELHPDSGEVNAELKRMMSQSPSRDMTTECLVFPDAQRATQFYGEAIQRSLEFVVYGGVVGDILEFGTLAGWTARLFAERMRRIQFFGDLHLYDSFAGLPRAKDEIDRRSYDVTRGIWADEMELPSSLIAQLGEPIDVHVKRKLSTVIDGKRIHTHKGFYSDTLKEPIRSKAAIVHLDCDLYQSTKEVLDALHRDSVLQDGTVMLFDDWNCNRANPAFGQRRALAEFIAEHSATYGISEWFSYGFNCVAFILHDLRITPQTAGDTTGG